MGICIGIMLGSLAINWIFNIVVNYFKLDHKQIVLEKEQPQQVSETLKNRTSKVKDSSSSSQNIETRQ